jgi:hypothetical protein
LDNASWATFRQVSLEFLAMAVTAQPPRDHWAQQLEVACQAQLPLFSGFESNSAHSTSWSVDLDEWHKNYNLQFVHGHQSNALEVAPCRADVQSPLERSQQVPDPSRQVQGQQSPLHE